MQQGADLCKVPEGYPSMQTFKTQFFYYLSALRAVEELFEVYSNFPAYKKVRNWQKKLDIYRVSRNIRRFEKRRALVLLYRLTISIAYFIDNGSRFY